MAIAIARGLAAQTETTKAKAKHHHLRGRRDDDGSTATCHLQQMHGHIGHLDHGQ